jgi:predicted RNA-binding protein associated with RNAse of E/G family
MARWPDISLEYIRPGRGAATYSERLLLDQPDVKVLAMDVLDAREIRIEGEVVLEPGASITWFVFPGQWHDVGKFHRADASFTGWYTDICTPVLMNGNHWSITDLCLDLWLPAQGPARWLDEEEFERAVLAKTLDQDLAAAARAERVRIDALLNRGDWPPAICRSWQPAIFR